MNCCFRCGEPMLQTERDEYEELSPTATIIRHIVLDECQKCQAIMTLIFPLLVVQPEAQP